MEVEELGDLMGGRVVTSNVAGGDASAPSKRQQECAKYCRSPCGGNTCVWCSAPEEGSLLRPELKRARGTRQRREASRCRVRVRRCGSSGRGTGGETGDTRQERRGEPAVQPRPLQISNPEGADDSHEVNALDDYHVRSGQIGSWRL